MQGSGRAVRFYLQRRLSKHLSMHHALAQPLVADLKRKSVVGGVAAVWAQGVKFGLQTATTIILARLLFRNRPALELMRRLANVKPDDSTVEDCRVGVAVSGPRFIQSSGTIGSARRELKVLLKADNFMQPNSLPIPSPGSRW